MNADEAFEQAAELGWSVHYHPHDAMQGTYGWYRFTIESNGKVLASRDVKVEWWDDPAHDKTRSELFEEAKKADVSTCAPSSA